MPTSEKNLSVKVTSKVELSALQQLRKEFNNNAKELSNLSVAGKQNTEVFQKLSATQKQLGQQIKEVSRESRGLSAQTKMSSSQMLEWGENITIVSAGLAFLLSRIVAFTTEAVKSAAELEIYRKKFDELAGGTENAEKQLELLRKASAGNFDDKELILYSNKMRLLGQTSDNTAKFLDIVERKADDVGITFEQGLSAVEKFVVAGRGRGLIELGINLNGVNQEMRKATGLTEDQINKLDEFEQEQIRINAILDTQGDSIENIGKKTKDTGDKIQSLSTIWSNFSTGAGKDLLGLFNSVYDIMKNVGIESGNLYRDFKDLVGIVEAFVSPLTFMVTHFNLLVSSIENSVGAVRSFLSPLIKIIDAVRTLNNLAFGGNEPTINIPAKDPLDKVTQKDNRRLPPKNTPSAGKKEVEDQLYTLDKFLRLLKAQIGLNEENYKQHLITAEVYNKENQSLLDQLNAQEKLIQVVETKGKTAEEIKATILENQTKFLREQLDLVQRINSVGVGRVSNSRTPRGEVGVNGLIDDFIKNIYGKPENRALPVNFNKSNADQVNRILPNSESVQSEQATNPLEGLLADSKDLASNLSNSMSILGIGADSFVTQLLNGFSSTLTLIDNIVGIIRTIGSISSGGGLGFLGSIFGIATSFIPGAGAIGALAGQAIGGKPDYSQFNGGRAGQGNSMRVSFETIRVEQRGDKLISVIRASESKRSNGRF